ncbi:MAG: GtrA family protein, partial [Phenylobacterium sp.]
TRASRPSRADPRRAEATARLQMPPAARLIRFLVSGGLATFVFFLASYLFLRFGWRPAAANLCAYATAFGLGYGLQRGWTFEARHAHGHALPRYFVVQAACAVLAAGVGEAGAWLGLSPLPLSLTSALACGAASYLASSFWVFPTGRG